MSRPPLPRSVRPCGCGCGDEVSYVPGSPCPSLQSKYKQGHYRDRKKALRDARVAGLRNEQKLAALGVLNSLGQGSEMDRRENEDENVDYFLTEWEGCE